MQYMDRPRYIYYEIVSRLASDVFFKNLKGQPYLLLHKPIEDMCRQNLESTHSNRSLGSNHLLMLDTIE